MERQENTERGLLLRRQAVQLATEMLAYDDERLVIGCQQMMGLLWELVETREKPFVGFLAVSSETDDLPLTVDPELLDAAYRERCVARARKYGAQVKEPIHKACRELIRLWADA